MLNFWRFTSWKVSLNHLRILEIHNVLSRHKVISSDYQTNFQISANFGLVLTITFNNTILYYITLKLSQSKHISSWWYMCLEISRYYPEMEEIKMNTEDKVQKYFKCYICNRIILYLINCQVQRWFFLVQPNEIIALHCYPVLLFKTLSFRSSTSQLNFLLHSSYSAIPKI